MPRGPTHWGLRRACNSQPNGGEMVGGVENSGKAVAEYSVGRIEMETVHAGQEKPWVLP